MYGPKKLTDDSNVHVAHIAMNDLMNSLFFGKKAKEQGCTVCANNERRLGCICRVPCERWPEWPCNPLPMSPPAGLY